MKKLVLLLSLSVAACSTIPDPSKITEQAKQIQGYTQLACKFVPTIATIAAIVSSGATAPLSVIAQDICTAVTTAPLADGGKRIAYYKGVEIKGKFVR